jgi:hypothetical protein
MCDYVPVEIRNSAGQRVGDSLVGLVAVLGGTFLIVAGVIILADPASIGSAGPPAGVSVLLLCVAAGLTYVGFVRARSVISDRLIVTRESLICRVTGWTGMRTVTIPLSSVTSFTVKTSNSRAYRHAVYAVLDSGQQVRLPPTAREKQAAAAAIAGELTTFANTAVPGPGSPMRS